MADETENGAERAHEIFTAFLRSVQGASDSDFEQLCAAHPEIEAELKKLDEI